MEEIHRAGHVGRGASFHVPSSITPLAPPHVHQPRKLPGSCTLGILIKASSSKHAAASKSLQSCPTLCDPIDGSPAGSHPWDCLVKNTGVGCHFLLQCMKVKSASEVAQSCLTLHDPMDCSLPGSSVHGIFQARALEWGATAFSLHIYIPS